MNLRQWGAVAAVTVAFLFAAGCRTTRAGGGGDRHAAAPIVGRHALDVLIEEGSRVEMQERQYAYRQEVQAYMQRDLPRRFARCGIDARVIRNRNECADPARHLLVVHYDSYNPGSAAARIAVGFGAGAASLDMSMNLYHGNKVILSWKDGCGTSGHWSRIVNKLDDNMAKKVKAFYGGQR